MSQFGGSSQSRLLAVGGIAVVLGGCLVILINAGLAPFLPLESTFTELAASRIFMWRQSLAILAALSLCFGSTALYLGQGDRSGPFGAIAFLLAFTGSAFLVAHEWNQVFFVRDLALNLPGTLEALENQEGMTPFDIGAAAAASVFGLGWIACSASMLASQTYARTGPILLIAGFFTVPLFGVMLSAVWGQVAGNLLLGAGWILLGLQLKSRAR